MAILGGGGGSVSLEMGMGVGLVALWVVVSACRSLVVPLWFVWLVFVASGWMVRWSLQLGISTRRRGLTRMLACEVGGGGLVA